jgi:hypothetical protein
VQADQQATLLSDSGLPAPTVTIVLFLLEKSTLLALFTTFLYDLSANAKST